MSTSTVKSSILTLFREPQDSMYKIPKYQRAYSWTSDEVEEFCDDLNKLASKESESYFFGAMITIENGNIKEIVDGQQRMTTFIILISQLYNLCQSIIKQIEEDPTKKSRKYDKIKDNLRSDIGDLSKCIKNEDKYKLELSKVDKEFFNKLLNISDKVDIMKIGIDIIKNLEEALDVKTNKGEFDKFCNEINEQASSILEKINTSKKIDKTESLILLEYIPKIDEISLSITYNDYKDGYYNHYINKFKGIIDIDNYTNKKIELYLLKEYINYRLKNRTIDSFIKDEDYIEEIDKNKFLDFIKFNSKDLQIESHKRLNNAYEIIDNNIIRPIENEENLDEKINKASIFIKKFIRQTYIANIPETDRETAYTMFEVLNDRGADLGVLELLRPHILQLLEGAEEYQDHIGEIWDDISSDKQCKNYLIDYLASYIPISSREKKLHNKYKEQFFNNSKTQTEIYQKMKDINDMKDVYLNLKDGKWPYKDSKVDGYTKNRLYQIIKMLEYKSSIPLLMAIYEVGNEDDFIFAIDILERVVFRYITICNMKPGKLTRKYNDIIQDIRRKERFDRSEFKNKLSSLLNENGADINSFKEKIDCEKMTYKRNGKNKIIKYFLSKLEDYYNDYIDLYTGKSKKAVLNKPYTAKIIPENIHIEHIYPYSAEKVINDLEPIKNNIGNLTLLEKQLNKEASNKDLKFKQEHYLKESIKITRLLDGKEKLTKKHNVITSWNLAEYQNRLELYRDMASKIFTLDGN